MWFTRISINNPVFATMMVMALVVLGLFSFGRLKVEQFPDISLPVVVVQTVYPGATPESVETEISRKVEEAVNTISGIDTLTSHSYQGSSLVIIQFNLAVDPAQAAQDVREKVAMVRAGFRREIDEPRIMRYDPADQPIFSIAVTNTAGGPQRTLRELTIIADQLIKKRLETVRGVGSVTLVGGAQRTINIHVNPGEMEALGIGMDQLLNAISTENQELPAGALQMQGTERMVQIKGRIVSPDDFNRIIVARRGGQPVLLSQIARVVDGQEEQESLALYNGQRTLALNVLRSQGENTIDVVDGLKESMAALESELSATYPGLQLSVIKDNSIQIRNSVNNVLSTLYEGIALTILIVFIFLNSWRSTVITGLTLPIALIGTFLFMFMFDFSINMMTLMALSLSIGLLIDDAIVVRENIVRHATMQVDGKFKSHREASLDGTKEIGLAVLATTSCIVAVFMPVGFMGGILGQFFHQFGITVAASVMISMFVSFTLDPMLSSVWYDPDMHGNKSTTGLYANTIGRFIRWFDRGIEGFTNKYLSVLKWSLRFRKMTLIIAAASFFGGLALPVTGLVGSEFVPQADYSESGVNFETPVGSSLELTESKLRQVETTLRKYPEIQDTYSSINAGTGKGKNMASIYIRLIPRADRTRSERELAALWRADLSRIAGITVTNVGPSGGAGGDSKGIRFNILGSDLDELARLSALVQAKMRTIDGVTDLETSLKADQPIIAIQPKRDIAADLGIGVAQISSALRPLLAGTAATTWQAPNGENYDVNVRLSPDDRNNVHTLSRLMLASSFTHSDGSARMVPLRQVANIVPDSGANMISRLDLNRQVEISANVVGRSSGQANSEVMAMLNTIDWPTGYRYQLGGSNKSMGESIGYAAGALLLAITFIYMILASQFGSFLQPITIMSSLPLTLIGVFLALMLFNTTINMFSIIGFIMLMGLVCKNAILLVDFALQARKAGMERFDSLVEAGKTRMRPILMTTLAMIFGMVPLAFGTSEGAEQRAPMGLAVIGGLITSTLLTLVVVPVFYTYMDDIGNWFKKKWQSKVPTDH